MLEINPFPKLVAGLSATEFEKYCLEVISAYAEAESLSDFTIVHNIKIKSDDGEYQIDVFAEFIALSVRFKVIIECKLYSRPIEREKIVVLADKIRSLGVQKGILISTSGFQRGALEYAKKHGISLLQIIDKSIMHIQASAKPMLSQHMMEFIRQMPDYYAYQWEDDQYYPDRMIYPSKSMIHEIQKRITEQYGPYSG